MTIPEIYPQEPSSTRRSSTKFTRWFPGCVPLYHTPPSFSPRQGSTRPGAASLPAGPPHSAWACPLPGSRPELPLLRPAALLSPNKLRGPRGRLWGIDWAIKPPDPPKSLLLASPRTPATQDAARVSSPTAPIPMKGKATPPVQGTPGREGFRVDKGAPSSSPRLDWNLASPCFSRNARQVLC